MPNDYLISHVTTARDWFIDLLNYRRRVDDVILEEDFRILHKATQLFGNIYGLSNAVFKLMKLILIFKPIRNSENHKISGIDQFRKIAHFKNFTICKTKNSINFQFYKLSCILSVRIICNLKKSKKFENLAVWKVKKIVNFEISKIFCLENSKNFLFGKFQKFSIWKIRKFFDLPNSKNFKFLKFQKFLY